MLSKAEVERVIALAGRAKAGSITVQEKGEMRALLSRLSPAAQDFAWPDLMRSTLVFIGMYSVAEMAAAHAS